MAALSKGEQIVGGVVLFMLITAALLPEQLRRHGDLVPAQVIEAYVEPPQVRRGPSRPVVVLVFSYRIADRDYSASSLFLPTAGTGNWSQRESAVAADFIARHPPGSSLTVRASRFYPWGATPEPPTQDPRDQRRGRLMLAAFAFLAYLMTHGVIRLLLKKVHQRRRAGKPV